MIVMEIACAEQCSFPGLFRDRIEGAVIEELATVDFELEFLKKDVATYILYLPDRYEYSCDELKERIESFEFKGLKQSFRIFTVIGWHQISGDMPAYESGYNPFSTDSKYDPTYSKSSRRSRFYPFTMSENRRQLILEGRDRLIPPKKRPGYGYSLCEICYRPFKWDSLELHHDPPLATRYRDGEKRYSLDQRRDSYFDINRIRILCSDCHIEWHRSNGPIRYE